MFDLKASRFWVLYSSFDMAMKLALESKDGFGTTMQTGKNTGLVLIDFTYKICQEKHPVVVRNSRAQTITNPNPNSNPRPKPEGHPQPQP